MVSVSLANPCKRGGVYLNARLGAESQINSVHYVGRLGSARAQWWRLSHVVPSSQSDKRNLILIAHSKKFSSLRSARASGQEHSIENVNAEVIWFV